MKKSTSRSERKALGERPRLRELKAIQDRLYDPVELVSPTYIGGILESLIKETVATLKPLTSESSDNPDWRNYILLHDYFVLGEPWKIGADRLSLSRIRFFEVTASAIEALALALVEGQPEEEAYAQVWLARLREQQARIEEACSPAHQAFQIFERVGLRTPFCPGGRRVERAIAGSGGYLAGCWTPLPGVGLWLVKIC